MSTTLAASVAAAAFVASSLFAFAPAADEPLSFVIDEGFELHGTLTLPDEGEGPFPAVLFLSGSGPVDRDGNPGPMAIDLHKQLAAALADAGIASFRYDKRALQTYAEFFPPMEEMGPFFGLERFASDAAHAVKAMRGHEKIDGERVGIAGHSEGAVLALMLAQKDNPPMAYGLLAGPGRPIAVVMREQLETQLQATMPAQKEESLAAIDRALEAAADGQPFPRDLPSWSRALFNPSTNTLMKDYVEVDPIALVREVEGPVLILSGEHDAQVSADRDATPLAAAARERDGGSVELVIVKGASHNFKAVNSVLQPGFAGDVVPAAREVFVSWWEGVMGLADGAGAAPAEAGKADTETGVESD